MGPDIQTEFNKQCGEITSLVNQLGNSEKRGKGLQEEIDLRIGNLQAFLSSAKGARFSEGSVSELNAYRERILKSDPRDLDTNSVKELSDGFQAIHDKVIKVMSRFDTPISLLPTAVEALIRRDLERQDAAALANTDTAHQRTFVGDINYKYLELARKYGLHGAFSSRNAQQEVTARVQRTVAILQKLYPGVGLGAETDPIKQLEIFQKLYQSQALKDLFFEEDAAIGKQIFSLAINQESADQICLALADLLKGQQVFDIEFLTIVAIKPLVNLCSPQVFQILVNMNPLQGFWFANLMNRIDKTTLNRDEKLNILLTKLTNMDAIEVPHDKMQWVLKNLVAKAANDPDFEPHVRRFISINPLFRLDFHTLEQIPNQENLSKDLREALVLSPADPVPE